MKEARIDWRKAFDALWDVAAENTKRLTAERDLARREVCRSRASCIKDKQPEEIANALGWDCFEERTP
jgi:hypothetical protein